MPLNVTEKNNIHKKVIEMSDKALRVLVLAYAESDEFSPNMGNLVFLGIAGMLDPPREEAKAAIDAVLKGGT